MDWAKLFSDTATYPDSLEFTIGDSKVTLGALRKHNTDTQGATAAKLQQMQERETQIATREANQQTAVTKLANIIEAVAKTTGLSFDQIVAGDTAAAQAAAAKIRGAAAGAGITVVDGQVDWDKDPIYAPIGGRFKTVEGKLDQSVLALQTGVKAMQDDRSRLAWLQFKVDNPDLAKGLKFEDAVQKAVSAGYRDEYGFPDIGKALNELADPIRNKAALTDAETAAEKRGYDKARAELAGSIAPPAGGGTAGLEFVPNPDKPAGKTVSIADQLSKALTDPAILSTVGSGTIQ